MTTWRRQGEPRGAKAPDAPARGRPLDLAVRGRMETRLGHDFSTVRVHHGPEAKALHARAFTVGEDVTFAPGQYAPGTTEGDRLLAHELGHVADARDGAQPGLYRAPDDGPLPTGPERPLRFPGFGVGSLTLGLGVLDSFAFNGSELTPDHRKQITQIADQLVTLRLKQPSGRITITGHTDLVGGEQANLDLGRKRAVAVAAALAQAGVALSAMDITSAGASTPVVETAEREPRNRRVEVRFAGGPVEPAQPEPPVLDPTKVVKPPIDPGPPRPTFPPKTPSPPTPAPQQPGQIDPGSPLPQTKPGSVGDLAKAVAATPQGKKLIDAAETQGKKDLGKLSTGEKVLLGSVVGAQAAAVIAGLAAHPGERAAVLDFVDGKEIPVPYLKGVSIIPHTKGGGVGGVVSFDILKFGGGKK
jgi:outer membrane protein OmpA-like peptidoglycan-associated protein